MTDKSDVDKKLKKLKEENEKEFKKIVNRSGLVMIGLSIMLAVTFFYIFYLSQKRTVDVLMIIAAILVSVAFFAMGLKRYLD